MAECGTRVNTVHDQSSPRCGTIEWPLHLRRGVKLVRRRGCAPLFRAVACARRCGEWLPLAAENFVGNAVDPGHGVVGVDRAREVDAEGQRLGIDVLVGDDVVPSEHLHR